MPLANDLQPRTLVAEGSPRYLSRGLLALLTALVAGMAIFAADTSSWYLFVGCSFMAGGVVLALWRVAQLSFRQVLFFAVLFRLLMVALPPSLSDDAYRYVWDGLVQVEGVNPYRYHPEDPALLALQDDEVYEALNSKSYYSVYPPVSQLVFAVGGLFHQKNTLVGFYVIKAILVLFELGGLFLLARLVTPGLLALYAWNPLVIIETGGQAHTESLLIFFLVLTIYFVRRGKGGWASVALACAGWVKLYPFVLFPFLWRRFGWRAVWTGGGVIAVLALPYAASYVLPNVFSSLDLYVRLFEFNAGLYYGVKEVFLAFTGDDWSKTLGPAFRNLFLVGLVVLYGWDAWKQWAFPRAVLATLGLYLVLATTVHPWYFLGPVLVATLLDRPSWHWYWVGLLSLGTYLFYIGGPYWTFVILGWGGWLVLALVFHADIALQGLQQWRAKRKFRAIEAYLKGDEEALRVMDLGAGEGYVGAHIQRYLGCDVVLVDVLSQNRTDLPHVCYDGERLPFDDDAFDIIVLYFVLHHCEDQEQVLSEALRVAKKRVVVVESVYEGVWDRWLLTRLDTLANRIRSRGEMKAQEAHLHFRTASAWKVLFEEAGAQVEASWKKGRWVHKQAFFVVRPAGSNS